MLAAQPPRCFLSSPTRNDRLMTCILSGRMWSLKLPGKSMMWSKASEPVTRISGPVSESDIKSSGAVARGRKSGGDPIEPLATLARLHAVGGRQLPSGASAAPSTTLRVCVFSESYSGDGAERHGVGVGALEL